MDLQDLREQIHDCCSVAVRIERRIRHAQLHARALHAPVDRAEELLRDPAGIGARELVKDDDLIDAVEKLRPQELIEGALRTLAALIVRAQAEAERAQRGDASGGDELPLAVVAVAGHGIDFRRGEQPHLIIVAQHTNADSGQF